MNQAAGSSSVTTAPSLLNFFPYLSFRSPWRRLSFGTTTTRVPEDDDVLEFDDGEDINNVDDDLDGDGGVSQAICTGYSRMKCADCSPILSMTDVLQSIHIPMCFGL